MEYGGGWGILTTRLNLIHLIVPLVNDILLVGVHRFGDYCPMKNWPCIMTINFGLLCILKKHKNKFKFLEVTDGEGNGDHCYCNIPYFLWIKRNFLVVFIYILDLDIFKNSKAILKNSLFCMYNKERGRSVIPKTSNKVTQKLSDV